MNIYIYTDSLVQGLANQGWDWGNAQSKPEASKSVATHYVAK